MPYRQRYRYYHDELPLQDSVQLLQTFHVSHAVSISISIRNIISILEGTCDSTMLDIIVPSDFTIATPVSSHDDSIPRTTNDGDDDDDAFKIDSGSPDNVCVSNIYLLLLLA